MPTESAHNHIRLVSLLTVVEGVIGMIPTLVMLLVALGLFGGGMFSRNPVEMVTAGGIVAIVAACMMILGLPALVAGFGLLARKPWARPLTLVIAVLNLFAFPIGTVFGIYQFWVLAMNEETVAAYKLASDTPSAREYA